MYIRASLILIFLTLCDFTFGQNTIRVAGKVLSEEGVVPEAFVMIGSQGSITNEKGVFKFQYTSETSPLELKIEVSALGYKAQELIFSAKETNFEELSITLSLFPNVNAKTALEDIKKGKIQFLLSGGIAPVIYSSDKNFTLKYGVSFYEFGCEAISNESLKKYNAVIAEYLDKKIGKKWRKEVRDDIIGIK
ncbi:carboxypeptidase-like regulatory domain-containing protein [Sabulilitoribacter arenilitoris]|uniref:Carboxypeptidase-like regulatory domain-containing protein n=1 Tax=Wocania arenilitoris TaxID=2044858 RepID=A0AAE3ENA2_9FLAO|nr:carboxypeptidase-like regulatory domain-containing protein [Wocania arenilitoris]MCF7567284.1 carboxypeptidase-like regulatory domain-containing protein [Wocania arenilitoris]